MQTYIFGILSAFFAAHAYRDYLHWKGIKHTFFTRVAHWWDAPQYELHGMTACIVLSSVFLWLTIH